MSVTTMETSTVYFCSCGVKPQRIEDRSTVEYPNDGEPKSIDQLFVSHIYHYLRGIGKYVWHRTTTRSILNDGTFTDPVTDLNPEWDAEVQRHLDALG